MGLVFLGLGLLFLAFAAAVLFLLKSRALKHHQPAAMDAGIPALPISRRIMESAFANGFPLFTLGLVVGVVYAGWVLPESWYLDVKIIWATVNWLFYSALIFCHQTERLKAQGLARGIMALFLIVLTSFLCTSHRSMEAVSSLSLSPQSSLTEKR
jgi:ABC-type transport system involved in cytochrome c biogenesis permease subunit